MRARTTRIVDDVTDYLRGLILDHKLPPGTNLLQTEWAERLGISRTPLREAFRLLERDGLVRVSNGNRTVEVVRYSADDLRDLYQLREVLDGLAARLLAAKGLTPDLDQRLAGLLARMDETDSPFQPSKWFAAHTEFHELIINECGNKQLGTLLNIVRSTSMALHRPMAVSDDDDLSEIREVASVQHRKIYSALRAGDSALAETVARKHITSTLRSELIMRATASDD